MRLGSTVARLKLTGIDGGPHKRWSMWFNSTQREEPYLGSKCFGPSLETGTFRKKLKYRCCMAVVSSCREMLGKSRNERNPCPVLPFRKEELAGDRQG